MTKSLADSFLDKDAPSLVERYRPSQTASAALLRQSLTTDGPDLISKRCEEFDIQDVESANLQEQQERELEPEAEKEREIERPPYSEPCKHRLHPAVERFVRSGNLDLSSTAFIWAFQSLKDTTASEHLDVTEFPRGLLVTQDFANTVVAFGRGSKYDAFKRDVRWILTSAEEGAPVSRMLIISPYEANQLIEDIEEFGCVRLHVYAPRQTLGVRPIDHLELFTIPARTAPVIIPHNFIVELNLFAGQLYFDSFSEYVHICNYLNLAWSATGAGVSTRADGFIDWQVSSAPQDRQAGFKNSPVRFLQILMGTIRRQCEGIERTHMGRVLDGLLLSEGEFSEVEEGLFVQ